MNHSLNNSQRSNRDEVKLESPVDELQLDQILRMADPPAIERQRRRRLNAHLDRLLGQNRPCLTLRANVARAAVGVTAVAGVVVLFSWISQVLVRNPEIVDAIGPDSSLSVSIDPVEPSSREIISHVVWTPPPVRRRQSRMSKVLRLPFDETTRRLNQFCDSETGLNFWESAASTVETLAKDSIQSRDPELRQAVGELLEMQQGIELRLVQSLRSSRVSQQEKLLAFRKLCRIGSTRSQSMLWNQWGNTRLGRDIVVAAKRIGSASLIAQMFTSTNDSELRVELMKELLERGDDESVGQFLELTADSRQFNVARESGRRAKRIPIEKLMLALQGNRLSLVRAASITLSRVDDPRVTEWMVELARCEQTRQVAVLALTARHDDQAARFVRMAARDLHWSATVASAQRKWNRWLAVN